MSYIENNIIVELTDVSKSYGKLQQTVDAVREVSFVVRRGERVALLGKSGSGKSTLLNMIAGLDRPTDGQIRVSERILSKLSPAEMADYRRERVGMIFQAYNLVPWRTALQNVELPMVFARRGKSDRIAAAKEALAAVGLAGRMDHRPSEFSGGEQQRVAIARALINSPELLLADEPTGNLDSSTAAEILESLSRFTESSDTATLLVTHDEELAYRFSTRVLHMQDGRLDHDSGADSA
ncbi:ABC transporter ATP-binding protein [Gimesia maris]|uniref:Lipoprotein-releasing system ATP-binding protein LolD n=1 Tax=Gimesia maris TaxID=122 RepID=A0ABX5YQ57_9PLAN|nr:ABC transporter ATP-binding protein [Gimesia maris]EDL60337.1 ABC transporter, ATPase subunit [Gimesia maris DSM 8797]QEG17894.1 Lipoprotein-releasing system ATP-binding protein LolD [Gimesia maris]QGQ29076.1 ABC transporter ATP-binding protein [Gimesia maris]